MNEYANGGNPLKYVIFEINMVILLATLKTTNNKVFVSVQFEVVRYWPWILWRTIQEECVRKSPETCSNGNNDTIFFNLMKI